MTVSMIKTNEDPEFPWELSVKKNGVLMVFDYFESRPSLANVFSLISEAEITL
jgi:hypothetical protein